MSRLATVPVAAIGTRLTVVHVHSIDPKQHGFREVEMPVYPRQHIATGAAFRRARVQAGLSLRDAAILLGLGVVEVSELERGHRTCDWAEAHRMLGENP